MRIAGGLNAAGWPLGSWRRPHHHPLGQATFLALSPPPPSFITATQEVRTWHVWAQTPCEQDHQLSVQSAKRSWPYYLGCRVCPPLTQHRSIMMLARSSLTASKALLRPSTVLMRSASGSSKVAYRLVLVRCVWFVLRHRCVGCRLLGRVGERCRGGRNALSFASHTMYDTGMERVSGTRRTASRAGTTCNCRRKALLRLRRAGGC